MRTVSSAYQADASSLARFAFDSNVDISRKPICQVTVQNNSKSGRLNYHVRCLLDEFANIGEIPQFEELIATIRSREISASIILQAKSQLKAIYKDSADTIEGNCDTMLFLGGKEKSTLKEISESLGKETIDSFNTSTNRGQSESYGMNYQKLGKELKSQDELAVMDGGKCILQLRGVRPFFSDKYDITCHKEYQYLSDEHPENAFDIGAYVKKRKDMHYEPKARDKVTRFDTHGTAVRQEVTKSDTSDDTEKNVSGTVSEETENKTESVETADNFTLF
ncbi:MAG: TraM recognition domain-containing protein [Oscillospiraceae bacterium]|nr:TraM recognition domain-containing protein [Oscillospiraceae bacterium]